MPRLLIIEDDSRIRTMLERALVANGHDVRAASTGLMGLKEAVDDPPDAIVLDLGLPDIDGRELLRMLRAVSAVPVIAATARDDEGEIVSTLNAGADDYVVKPFSGEQIEARLRAVLRRGAAATPAKIFDFAELHLDVGARVATLAGDALELTPKEFEMLVYLAERVGHVVSKQELMTEVWRQPYGGAEKSIDVHLSWLRSKLGESASAPRFLRVVRGVGIKLVDPS